MPLIDFSDGLSSDPPEPEIDPFVGGSPSPTPQSCSTHSTSPLVGGSPPQLSRQKWGSASQDLSQYATHIGRQVRLKVADRQELATLAQV